MATVANIAESKQAKAFNQAEKLATLNALVNAANDNKKKVPELRAFIAENPELPGKIASVAYTIRLNLLEKVVTGEGSRLLIQKNMEALEDRLRGDEPTEIEKLLIEAVLCCWLRLQHSENYKNSLVYGEHRFIDMEFADKMLSNAHSRYLRALTALAKVQDLNARKKKKQKKDIDLKQINGEWEQS